MLLVVQQAPVEHDLCSMHYFKGLEPVLSKIRLLASMGFIWREHTSIIILTKHNWIKSKILLLL